MGHALHSEEGIGLLNWFCIAVHLLEPEVLALEADTLLLSAISRVLAGRISTFSTAGRLAVSPGGTSLEA